MQELGDVATAQQDFERWLERQPLAERTKTEYRRNVGVFLNWLAADRVVGWDSDPLSDRLSRDQDTFVRRADVRTRAGVEMLRLGDPCLYLSCTRCGACHGSAWWLS